MSITFKKRGLMVTFKLAQGAFNDNNDDSVDIERLAIRAQIQAFTMGTAQAQISVSGLSIDLINRLTTLRATPKGNAFQLNSIKLTMQEEGEQDAVLFNGYIYLAIADFNAAPDIPLMIHASSLYAAIMTVPRPKNFPGTSTASSIINSLATEAGFAFFDHGTDETVRDVSLNGDIGNMLRTVARMANIDMYIEADTVHIAKKGQPRQDVPLIPISKNNGLIGYPRPIDFGCLVSCLYNTRYRVLAKANVDVPEIPVASGEMFIASVMHRMDSEIPQGQWFTDMKLLRFNAGTTQQQGG